MAFPKFPAKTLLPPDWQPETAAAFRQRMLQWFAGVRRDLPWRRVRYPYAIWVSEVMLQQTQVQTVIAYYDRWMARFPTLESLARAPVDDVLEVWAGLGYYRRARMLHQGARVVLERHGGLLPPSATELRALPGIGPYTAGAIASIAFGEPAALVDGNVARVLSRLFAMEIDPKAPHSQRVYWQLAESLVDPDAPGDYNQSLMELGATVCTPHQPTCLLCPVRELAPGIPLCRGWASGEPSRFPAVARRAVQRPMRARLAMVVRQAPGQDPLYLVVRRPETGLLAGMWQFPMVEAEGETVPGEAALTGHLRELGVTTLNGAATHPLGHVTHQFSHIRLEIEAHWCALAADATCLQAPDQARWVTPETLALLPMSSAMRKVEKLAGKAVRMPA